MFCLCSHMIRTLADYPFVVVNVDCTLCSRTGRYRLARLVDRYGADCRLDNLLDHLAGDCRYRERPRHPIKPGCGARFPDLIGRDQPPPDFPPAKGLRLVKR